MFARRAGWDLLPNELSERAAQRRAAGLPLLDLTESNPTRCGLPFAGERLCSVLESVARDPSCARYEPDPRGDARARESVAAYHAARGAAVAADSILLTAGTSEGYAHLFRLLADPGERVLVPSPSYPLFGFLAGLESVDVEPYLLRRSGGRWTIDLDSVARAAAPPTRAILLVHPNNPTGSLASRDEIEALREICGERDLALLSDEVFADYRNATAPVDAPRTLLPSRADREEGPLTFVLSGASKVLGLPQLKVGWIAVSGSPALRDEAMARLEIIADTYLSVSGPAQLALPALLAAQPEMSREIALRVAENRARLAAAVARHPGAELLEADGGWHAIVRLGATPSGPAPEEDALVAALLDGPGVIIQPGWLFDLAPRDESGAEVAHVVLSLLPEPEPFAWGIAELFAATADASR